jgi:hypothetical protein
MIDRAVCSATGCQVVVPSQSKSGYYTDLAGFEACLKLARTFFFKTSGPTKRKKSEMARK